MTFLSGILAKAMVVSGSLAFVSGAGLYAVNAISSGQAAKTELTYTTEIANRNAQKAKIANTLAIEKSVIEQRAIDSKAQAQRRINELTAKLKTIETDGIECPENCYIPHSLLR